MKKTSFISSLAGTFSGRKVRFGGYATLLVVVALAIVVVINVVVQQIPGKLDLTKNHMFSLSPETYKVLDGLSKDITISMVGRAGSEDPTVKEILSRYATRSHHIKLQTMDPDRNPGWARQFDTGSGQGLGAGSVVVQSGDKNKVIGQYDMYNYDYSNPNQQPTLTSLSVEQRVTSAINYVTAARNVTIYVLQGHGEQTLDAFGLATPVSNENYAVKPVTLVTAAGVPADADILLIMAPKSDISSDDDAKIRKYLDNGGRALFLMDPKTNNTLPTLDGILKSYGVDLPDRIVVEGDQNSRVSQLAFGLVPKLEYHDIVSPLRTANVFVLLPAAQPIQTLSLRKRTLKIEPLLSSSDNSWAKPLVADMKTLEKQSGDLQGPFTLAVAITDPASDPSKKDTKIIVVGSASFLAPTFSSQIAGNTDFFLNSLGWLRGKADEITVRPKDMLTMRLGLNSLQALLFSGLVVILMPLLVLGAGFTVWIRRRHL